MTSHSHDPYVYAGTNVLRNNFDLYDYDELQTVEKILTSRRLQELITSNKITGNFDEKHLRNIHHYIFQDLYNWAGNLRTIDISKDETGFAPHHFFRKNFEYLEAQLREKNQLSFQSKKQFVQVFGEHLNDLNHIHPFREGNGRTQREFFRQLAKYHEFDLRFSRSKELYLEGTIKDDKTITSKALEAAITNEKPLIKTQQKQNSHSKEKER